MLYIKDVVINGKKLKNRKVRWPQWHNVDTNFMKIHELV
jgi:hypothetical protein